MFSLFKKRNTEIADLYSHLLDQSRTPKLYSDYNVPDTPQGRFQMITLHAAPHILALPPKQSQALFDMIFQDIEYSFREIGVGDLAVPKKMKRYMKDLMAFYKHTPPRTPTTPISHAAMSLAMKPQ